MRIQSKNTGIVHYVKRDEWDAMRSRGDHRHYKVIDESDDDLETREIKVEPIELIIEEEINDDLADIPAKSDGDDEKQFYKDFLDEKGIKYTWNEGIEKLKQKYEENI